MVKVDLNGTHTYQVELSGSIEKEINAALNDIKEAKGYNMCHSAAVCLDRAAYKLAQLSLVCYFKWTVKE